MNPVQLKTHCVLIDAPREMVFQKMTAFDRGQMPGHPDESSEVLSRDGDSLSVKFRNRAGFITYTSVEQVTLYPPGRITFKHLSGPLHYAYDEFLLEDRDGQTLLSHRGEIVWSPVPLFGWLGAVLYTRPMFERVVARHMAVIKSTCEARASRSHVFRRKDTRSTGGA